MSDETRVSDWFPCGDEVIHTRLELAMMRQLSESLHKHQMHLMVEIPTMEKIEPRNGIRNKNPYKSFYGAPGK